MVQPDKKLVHPDLRGKLSHFRLDSKNPLDWMPRGGIITNPLPPGLEGTTKAHGFKMPYNRYGLSDDDFPIRPKCRFCGSDLYLVEETNDAFVWGCPMETCKNNPDNPYSDYIAERARRRMSSGGTQREDLLGESPPHVIEITNIPLEASLDYRIKKLGEKIVI